jgi:hypothetical protein
MFMPEELGVNIDYYKPYPGGALAASGEVGIT